MLLQGWGWAQGCGRTQGRWWHHAAGGGGWLVGDWVAGLLGCALAEGWWGHEVGWPRLLLWSGCNASAVTCSCCSYLLRSIHGCQKRANLGIIKADCGSEHSTQHDLKRVL